MSIATIKFLSDKAKSEVLEKTKAAGVEQNEFYFEDVLGVVRLNPFRCFVLDTFKHHATLDGEGKLDEVRDADFNPYNTKFNERHLTLVLVKHPAGWLPAVVTTYKAMARPWKVWAEVKGKSADQVKGTPGYEHALEALDESGRVVLEITGGQEQGKGKYKYNAAKGKASGPSAEEVAAYNAFVSSAAVLEAKEQFDKLVSAVQEKIS